MQVVIPLEPFLSDLSQELKSATDSEIENTLKDIADYFPVEARLLMDTANRMGNTGYRASGEAFTRSAVGEIPAKDSFELYNTLTAEMSGNRSIVLTFAYHAFYLDPLFEDFGEAGGYLNRPFIEQGLGNAVEKLETL